MLYVVVLPTSLPGTPEEDEKKEIRDCEFMVVDCSLFSSARRCDNISETVHDIMKCFRYMVNEPSGAIATTSGKLRFLYKMSTKLGFSVTIGINPTNNTSINKSIKIRNAHASLGYPDRCLRSNSGIDWPVHSFMLSFHDLRGLPLRRLPSTEPCSSIIFGSVSWRQTWLNHDNFR